MKTLRILVSGHVQGVFYRQSTVEQARSLGLLGWVRNLPDERVEICCTGDEEALAALVEWAKHGPRMARVTGVEVSEVPSDRLAGVSSFAIAPTP